MLPELGVHAAVHRAHVEQTLGGPEVDFLADGLVLLGAPFEIPEAWFRKTRVLVGEGGGEGGQVLLG